MYVVFAYVCVPFRFNIYALVAQFHFCWKISVSMQLNASHFMIRFEPARELIMTILYLQRDLRECDVDVVTLGQYLRPSRRHMSVQRYVTPEEFNGWKETARQMGFRYAAAGPLVRSSYRAGELFLKGVLTGEAEKSLG